jgi:hypothetical protein
LAISLNDPYAHSADSQTASLPQENQAQRLFKLYWIALAAAVMNVLRGFHWNPGGTLWVDPYWLMFYLNNYPDGFRMRALVGSVCRVLFPGGLSVVTVNIFALLMLVSCLVLFFRALCTLAGNQASWRRSLMLFAIAASTVTAAFYETMGDLLHVALLLYCVTAFVLVRYVRNETVRLAALTCAVLLCFLTHEASIFALVPAMPFILKARPRLRDFVVPALLFVGLLLVASHWGHELIWHPSTHANLYPKGVQAAAPLSTPTYANELTVVHREYFGSHDAKVYFVGRCLRIVVLILVYLTALAVLLPTRIAARAYLIMGLIQICSVPLWIVAIDWGRFLTYGMVVAVVSCGLWQRELESVPAAVPQFVLRVRDAFASFAEVELFFFATVYVLLASSNFTAVHIDSMFVQDAQMYCIVIVFALFQWRRRTATVAI